MNGVKLNRTTEFESFFKYVYPQRPIHKTVTVVCDLHP